jgi:hypothetical protein
MEKVKVVDQELGVGISMQELQDMPEVSTRDKVERFITEQCAPAYPQQSQSTHHGPHHDNQCAPAYPQQSQSTHHGPHHDNQSATAYPPIPQVAVTNTSQEGEPLPHRPADLNPNATEYHANNRSPQSDPGNEMKSYVNFMARRELIANKIEKFDDNPVNYHTWKASFKNMIRNVGITPSEEFSLLVEYTTLTSKSLVQRLRNAYIGKPHEGITEIWKKLDERYGCSSVLVKAHLAKLSSVPKINYKDNRKLQEFSDLLLELNCAKKDGVLTGLRVLDEPIYLKPVIAKLPGDVQGRWQRHAFRFINDKQVPYPPFNEFARFIGEVSQEKNDPNLCLSPPEDNLNLENSRAKPRRAYKTAWLERNHPSTGNRQTQDNGVSFIGSPIPSINVVFSGQNRSRKGELY